MSAAAEPFAKYFGLSHVRLTGAEQAATLKEMALARDATPQQAKRYLVLRNRLLCANLRLILSIAKRFHGLPVEDLISEGVIGAIRGLERFDPVKYDVRLSTYLSWWISQAVRRAVQERARTIRQPVHLLEARPRVHAAIGRFESQHGRRATVEELAGVSGLTVREVRRVLSTSELEPASLDAPIGDDRGSFHDVTAGDAPSPEDIALARERAAEAARLLATIESPRSREVIEARFGLNGHGGETFTLEEVGGHLGLSRERIRQLQTEALRSMRARAVDAL